MTLKLFELVELFMMDIFLLKLTQFEKTGLRRNTFISLGNLILIFILEIRSRSRSPGFTLLMFNSGVCLPLNNENALSLTRNHK